MGLSASQGRMLLLTARKSDLEFKAQQISQKRLVLSQQLEEISSDYEDATANRQMKISLSLSQGTDGNDVVSRTSNLTYATLISGTLAQFSSSDSGLASYSRTEGQEYSSNSAYRLTDAYVAIVVSSEEEIPGTSVSKTSVVTAKDEDGVYRVGNTTTSNTKEKTGNSYVVIPKTSSGTDSALGLYLKDSANAKVSREGLQVDTNNKLVQLIGTDGNRVYYDYTTGEEVDSSDSRISSFSSTETVNLVEDAKTVPNSTQESVSNNRIVKGSDGKRSLVDSSGVVLARYVVDPTLQYGSSDSSGVTDGPNYLQDCLRNGKYLLEKARVDTETKEVKWNSLSWDATSNIMDSYYTEDDDKAKARYDRLQTQIQTQDKKLELELDNLETQRKAVTTEEESVKKVIDDNIEGSFKTFA